MGTPRRPRQPRNQSSSNNNSRQSRNQSSSNNNSRQSRNQSSDDDEGAVRLSIEAERTIGSLGGIRTDATATVGIDAFTRNNRVTGFIDPANRSAGLGMGIGSAKKKLGGEVELNVQLNENGSINSIGGNIAGSFLGFGAGIGGSTAGDRTISGQAFGIGVGIARDEEGNVTLQTCFGIGIIEACTTFSRDKGDPQNTEGTIKGPVLGFTSGSKPARPKKPNAPGGNPTRKKPQPKAPKADTPKPNPRPQPDQPDKIRTDKKPQLDTKKKPVGFGKKPVINTKKNRH